MRIAGLDFSEQQLRQMATNLNDNCHRESSHAYNRFLQETRIAGKTLIDIVRDLHALPVGGKHVESRSLGLAQEEQFDLIKEFFNGLDADLGRRVESILDNKNKRYKVQFINEKNSHAGHSEENNYIDIVIFLNDHIKNLVDFPHELAHAISGYNTEIIKLVEQIKEAEKSKDKNRIDQARQRFWDFTDSLGKFDKDCIGEIESHIVERLFYRFLIKKNLITDEDYQNYRIGEMNSFLNNLTEILEEFEIINNLPDPISYESALDYVKKLMDEDSINSKRLLNRLYMMASPDKKKTAVRAKWAMRYIVGEIVSSEWFDKYEQADCKEKVEMKKRFVEYLLKTAELKVEDACQFLLNKRFGDLIEDFVEKIVANNVTA